MKYYRVTITEHLDRDIYLYAENADKAVRMVEERYRRGEFVLNKDDYNETSYSVRETPRERDAAR